MLSTRERAPCTSQSGLFFASQSIDVILQRPEGDLRVPETGASPREPSGRNQSLHQLGGSDFWGRPPREDSRWKFRQTIRGFGGKSYLPLQLHELRSRRLQDRELRYLAPHHGHFIAVVLPRTAMAVFVELVGNRSEEHTSELQSRRDLVCR